MLTNIDEIVMGSNAVGFLRGKGLMPNDWALPKRENVRILEAEVRLTGINSPASILSCLNNPFKEASRLSLVMFDITGFETAGFNREEIIATLLHEIGHVVNRPAPRVISSSAEQVAAYVDDMKRKEGHIEEFEADDYARHCEFGNQIITSLEKMAARNAEFATGVSRMRIDRIRKRAPLILHFH